MERKRTRTYRVVDLHTGDVWDFWTATAVAEHLWGQFPIQRYAIFKHGVRWGRRSGGEITRYARALDRWEPPVEED